MKKCKKKLYINVSKKILSTLFSNIFIVLFFDFLRRNREEY